MSTISRNGGLASTPVQDLLQALGSPQETTAAGTAAALTAAMAASLVSKVARDARHSWDDAGGVVAAAESLRAQFVAMADGNERAYQHARAILVRTEPARTAHGGPTGPGAAPLSPEQREVERSKALLQAASVPAAICELAAQVAHLAHDAETHTLPDHRADARAAAHLAVAAAAAAAHLVTINRLLGPDDPMVLEAQEAARECAAVLEARR
jgi:formiminotetrahydrofolate cyclodeaminase